MLHNVRSAIMRSVTLFLSLLAGIPLAGPPARAWAQSAAPRPALLAEDAERDLALEALPPAMRAGAGVWVLTATGYRALRPSSNGYTCMVNRDEVEAIKPTCFDEEGTATILPVNVFFGNLLMQRVPVPEIRRRVAEGYRTSRFRSPARIGIAFMMSPHIVNVMTMPDGKVMKDTASPHYMLYAPNVTNGQLKIPPQAYETHPWLPSIAYTGPAGFLIVSLPDSAVENAMSAGR
jgi:hypothetical protein